MKMSPAQIAVLGVVVALTAGGSAGAAAKLITGKQIKDGSIELADLSKKAKAALKGARGEKGDDGAAGTTGVNGSAGLAGQTGAAGPSLVMSSSAINAASVDGGVSWAAFGGGSVGNESSAQVPMPPGTSFILRDLSVRTMAAMNGNTVITVRNGGVGTALTCTIVAAGSGCTSTNSVTVNPGDLISIQAVNAGTVNSSMNTILKVVY